MGIIELEKSVNRLKNWHENLLIQKLNIFWGLSIAFLSTSLFLFLVSILDYFKITIILRLVVMGIIFLIILIFFVIASKKYNNQLDKLGKILNSEEKFLKSLKKANQNPIFKKIIDKTFR